MYTQTNLLSIRNPLYSAGAPIRIIWRMELAERLKKAMKDCGNISQYKLGPNAEVPQPTINRILKGISKEPRRSTLEKLADTLGVSRDWLISGIGEQVSSATKPPVLEFKEWGSLSYKHRAFIERVALSDIHDDLIDTLEAVMGLSAQKNSAPIPKKPLSRPASASGGKSSSLPAYSSGKKKKAA